MADSSLSSYTSQTRGLTPLLRELINLVQAYSGDVKSEVELLLQRLDEVESSVRQQYDLELERLKMLDIGPGQRLMEMKYFASRPNDVSGVDRDVIVQGLDLRGYGRMLRTNGAKRTIKTIGRKMLRIDARYTAELARQLHVPSFPRLPVYRMNASALSFDDATFDFVYSLAVFQHLETPQAAIAEIERVLKPGGVMYVDFMPYAGPPGALDIRQLGGRETPLPPWAHLRAQYQSLVQESSYLNRLRLATWERLFEERMRGCKFVYVRSEAESLSPTLQQIRDGGELLDYDFDELLTSSVIALWQKPEKADR